MEQTYSLEISPEAYADMEKIFSDYIMLGSNHGAVRIQNKFIKSVDLCHTFPYCGKIVPNDELATLGFRMMIVENYIMFYRIFESKKKVIFYRIFDGRTNYQSLMQRYGNSDETENEEEK